MIYTIQIISTMIYNRITYWIFNFLWDSAEKPSNQLSKTTCLISRDQAMKERFTEFFWLPLSVKLWTEWCHLEQRCSSMPSWFYTELQALAQQSNIRSPICIWYLSSNKLSLHLLLDFWYKACSWDDQHEWQQGSPKHLAPGTKQTCTINATGPVSSTKTHFS